jgi:hypothetical protein
VTAPAYLNLGQPDVSARPRARLFTSDGGPAIAVVDLSDDCRLTMHVPAASQARAIAAAFTEAAELLDEHEAGRDGSRETAEACPRCQQVTWGSTPFGQPRCTNCGYVDDTPVGDEISPSGGVR